MHTTSASKHSDNNYNYFAQPRRQVDMNFSVLGSLAVHTLASS